MRPLTAALLDKLIAGIEQADPSGIGLTTKEIQRKTFGSQGDFEENEALAEAVLEICGEHFNGRQLGRRVLGSFSASRISSDNAKPPILPGWLSTLPFTRY